MKKHYFSKNTKPKSLILSITCFVMGLAFLGFGGVLLTGCGANEGIRTINERYVVVPYSPDTQPAGNSATNAVGALNETAGVLESNSYSEAVSEPAKLQQWAENGYTYTHFYLGYIKNVPIDFQTSVYYDGSNDL